LIVYSSKLLISGTVSVVPTQLIRPNPISSE
jgi:hypothetical protein